ncbi:hypothetical protein ACGFXB_46465 [Streptomyces canus]|uniref:hypothetical protein n=1 Tax=Streptomyces canus TaxID=58343 RepID=UPI00371499F3
MPGLTTTGTPTVGGTTHQVSGRTWVDRRWGPEGTSSTERPRFTWLGLDLGRYLSVRATTDDGTSWLTERNRRHPHPHSRASAPTTTAPG